jgi:hypothetical protein
MHDPGLDGPADQLAGQQVVELSNPLDPST